jgi:beta-N-acetylhexosaminidase
MTLEQEAAQVMLMAVGGTTLSEEWTTFVAGQPPGGFLLLKGNVASASQLEALVSGLQAAALRVSQVGFFVAVDQEGGSVQRVPFDVPAVPSARSLGAQSTPHDAARLATATAEGLLSLGINLNLAPVADVVAAKSSFLYSRSYGSNAERVSAFVAAVVGAYEDAGLVSTAKHFPGHGSANGNTHSGLVASATTRAVFETTHLPPFSAAVSAGVEAVMVAHIVAEAYDPDNPASRSRTVIEDLLRGQLGFEGLVVTDDIMMAGASVGTTDSDDTDSASQSVGAIAVDCLNAGCDLLVSTAPLATQRATIAAIVAAVRSGSIARERLDEAVLRNLEVKLRHGLVTAF